MALLLITDKQPDTIMLNTPNECRDFSRMLESRRREGRYREAMAGVAELVRSGDISMENGFSLRTLYEETVPDGRAFVREMEFNRRHGRGGVMMEAGGDALSTADFSNIIGQVSYASVMEEMEKPDLIGRDLIREVPAETQQQEIVPGVTMIGDQAQSVGENEDYPLIGFGEQWIVAPEKVKTGFMIAVTEEAIAEDKTNLVMNQMQKGSEWLAINQERERLRMLLGITTSFRWKNEAAQATYADSHVGFVLDNLLAGNGLVDYTDLDVLEQAFDATVDPSTGELVSIRGAMDLVFPKALKGTVARVLNATEVRQGAVDASTPLTVSQNPLNSPMYNSYTPRTSQYVKETTGSDSTWFAGKFNEAFEDRVIYPIQVFAEDRGNHGPQFERDLVARIKVRRKSAPTAVAPWKVKKCVAA